MPNEDILTSTIPYGSNKDAGNYVTLNDVKLYYEIYGEGEPLVLLHGNGGNIEGLKYQIDYFSKQYKVIALDCRGRGKSELGKETLSYMLMTKDLAALLDYLKIDSAYIMGRSDGGIIGLLMAIHFPEKVKRIIAYGANVSPQGLYPNEFELDRVTRIKAEEMLEKGDTSQDWNLIYQRFRMMECEPNISADELKKIEAPVLVMSSDRDLITEEHSLFIYRNILKANLCILSGETHWITTTNPVLFNETVSRYLSQPFKGEEIRK